MSLARILGKVQGRQTFAADPRWVLPNCYIGLEHEYEGVEDTVLPKHTFADFWAYHREDSLKDHGAEYVFAQPMFGVDAYNAIEWLVSHASTAGWKCSKRSGIHVHLDVRDISAEQLAGLCILYAAVEPILYRWVGDARDVSHFCLPLHKADDTLNHVASIVRTALQDDANESQNTIAVAEVYQRYAGLNLQSLQKFGTLEFRHLQTTHDHQRIVDWINIVMSLKASVQHLPRSDGAAVKLIEQMGPLEFLNYIFPQNLVKQLYTEYTEEEFYTIGIPAARDIGVQGCSPTRWSKNAFPKGEHKGFKKWLKTQSPSKAKDSDPYPELIEDFIIRDEAPRLDNNNWAAAEPPAANFNEFLNHPVARDRLNRLMRNDGLRNAAQAIPAAPPRRR